MRQSNCFRALLHEKSDIGRDIHRCSYFLHFSALPIPILGVENEGSIPQAYCAWRGGITFKQDTRYVSKDIRFESEIRVKKN
jgi:hypothetical protein